MLSGNRVLLNKLNQSNQLQSNLFKRYLLSSAKSVYPTSKLITTNSNLYPRTTLSSTFKFNILRTFTTTGNALSYYRPPKNTIIGGGVLSRIWSRIPDGIKLLGLVGISAYFVIFIAVPVLFMVLPPVILGGWLFVKMNKFSRTKKMEKRWDLVDNSSLVFKSRLRRDVIFGVHPDQVNEELVHFEMDRIIDAFWDNEQGIADSFQITDINNLALGTIDAIEYSYKSTNTLYLAENHDNKILIVQSRSLYNKALNKEIANVIMTIKSPINFTADDEPLSTLTKGTVAIEIIPLSLFSKTFVLNTTSSSTRQGGDDGEGDVESDGDEFYTNADGDIVVKGKTKVL